MPEAPAAEAPIVAERLGSRWIHAAPSEEQVREWFALQPLHPGMTHDPYVGGIVVIAATEKVKESRRKSNGDVYVTEVERLVFTPYVKVDTRIAYFRDYIRVLNGGEESGEFISVIEPVVVPRITNENSAYFNGHLPDGYTMLPIRNENDSVSRYVVATFRVAIYERESYARILKGEKERPVMEGRGSKQTPLAKRFADENAIMKAETGAIGRALGVAGILVVGTGVATAEDMQEATGTPNTPGPPAQAPGEGAAPPSDPSALIGPAMPPESAPVASVASESAAPAAVDVGAAMPKSPQEQDEALRAKALKAQEELSAHYPEEWAAYKEWWAGRFQNTGIAQLTGPALNGAVVKLERDLDAARRKAASAPSETVSPEELAAQTAAGNANGG